MFQVSSTTQARKQMIVSAQHCPIKPVDPVLPDDIWLTPNRAIRFGTWGEDRCDFYLTEKDAIVRLRMDAIDMETKLAFPIEVLAVSATPEHLLDVCNVLIPGMRPVWDSIEVLWMDDF